MTKIVSALKARDGVFIEFEDGRAALYPASLLAEIFSRAIEFQNPDPDET